MNALLRTLSVAAAFTLILVAAITPATAANTIPEQAQSKDRLLDRFLPFRSTSASMSPDGQHLAYSLRKGKELWVFIIDLSQPEKLKTSVCLGTDDQATPAFTDNDEKTPLAIQWMIWVNNERLLLMTNHVSRMARDPLGQRARYTGSEDPFNHIDHWNRDEAAGNSMWMNAIGAVITIEVNGKDARTILTSRELMLDVANHSNASGAAAEWSPYANSPYAWLEERGETDPDMVSAGFFDFPADDPDSVIITGSQSRASNYYKLNARTGKLTHLRQEWTDPRYTAMFDRRGRVRVGIENQPTTFPIRYMFQKEGFSLGRWTPIDQTAGTDRHGDAGFSLSSENVFGRRSIPLGFDEDPNLMYFASNLDRDAFGVYAMDVRSGKRTDFSVEIPGVDLIPLTFNRFPRTIAFNRFDRRMLGIRFDGEYRTAQWLRPELKAAQAELESTFPFRNVEILEWDSSFTKFLVLVHDVITPGAYYIYQTGPKKQAFEMVARSEITDHMKRHHLMRFSVPAAAGHKVSGFLIFPSAARFQAVPVVVRCPPQPWSRASLDYQAECAALADMGFAVLEIDSRGAWGFGMSRRESFQSGYEATIVEDILTAIDSLAKKYRINSQRVALLGEGYGGFVALRALQLEPTRFRCAVTIDAPLDLASWIEFNRWTTRSRKVLLTRDYYGDKASLAASPLVKGVEKITKPVCLLAWPGIDGGPRTQTYLDTRQFASALRRQGTPVELNEVEEEYYGNQEGATTPSSSKSAMVELDREFAKRLPRAQAAVYRTIESFLNAYIYDYAVRLGPLKLMPEIEQPSSNGTP